MIFLGKVSSTYTHQKRKIRHKRTQKEPKSGLQGQEKNMRLWRYTSTPPYNKHFKDLNKSSKPMWMWSDESGECCWKRRKSRSRSRLRRHCLASTWKAYWEGSFQTLRCTQMSAGGRTQCKISLGPPERGEFWSVKAPLIWSSNAILFNKSISKLWPYKSNIGRNFEQLT